VGGHGDGSGVVPILAGATAGNRRLYRHVTPFKGSPNSNAAKHHYGCALNTAVSSPSWRRGNAMSRIKGMTVALSVIACCLLPLSASTQNNQQESQTALPEPEKQPSASLADFQKLQQEFHALKADLDGQTKALDTIRTLIQTVAGAVTIVGVLALLFQVWVFIADSRSRRRNQEESAKQTHRENALNERYVKLLDVAASTAEKAQQKVTTLEEGGIKRAADTLQLINNLLQITERAAAKAAGAQFEFLSRSIGALDAECHKLIAEAKGDDDERDIVGKLAFSERVRVLSKQIETLDHQITLYNESVPQQLSASSDAPESEATGNLSIGRWTRLTLTAPSLFIRGLNNHLDQNFTEAINDWKASLSAKGDDSIRTDTNYWIGYVENTRGNFEDARIYFKEAARTASEKRAPELIRLDIEARFFALLQGVVPDSLLDEGKAQFDQLLSNVQVPKRPKSSFATTMGNIALVHNARFALANGRDFGFSHDADHWFGQALQIERKTRWARFGRCQNFVLSNRPLDSASQDDAKDVIRSVINEYQNRIEDRSKALSKVTEYICMIMLGRERDPAMATIAGLVEMHSGKVTARTMYSQFRKQNVSKDEFLTEFRFLQSSMNIRETFQMANTPKLDKGTHE